MMTQKITRGRRSRISLSLLLALGLILALATTGLAAPPAPGDAPTAENNLDELWVQPTRGLDWEASAAPDSAAATLTGPAAPAVTSPLVMCSVIGPDVSITAATLATVVECSLTAPQSGSLYIAANATATAEGGAVEGAFRLGVDGTSWNYDRTVSVYTDPLKARNKVATINGLQPVGAGAHTVRFEARRSRGPGTLRLLAPSITAIFIPSTGTFRTCSNSVDGTWTTTSTGSLEVTSCSLTAPTSGYLFFAVNSWITSTDGSYEAFYRVQQDNGPLLTPGADVTYRRQDVYSDVYGGGDGTFTVTGIRWVDAGSRTTTLRAGKWGGSGPGTVTLNDPNVMAFFFSPGEANAQVCDDQPPESWFNWLQEYRAGRGCELNLSQTSRVFISADGYAGQYVPSAGYPYTVGPYEMGARLGLDSPSGLPPTQRQLNVIEDGRDMSDMGFANAAALRVAQGTRRFYWSGATLSDPADGIAAVYRIGMSVIAIPIGAETLTYMPLIMK